MTASAAIGYIFLTIAAGILIYETYDSSTTNDEENLGAICAAYEKKKKEWEELVAAGYGYTAGPKPYNEQCEKKKCKPAKSY